MAFVAQPTPHSSSIHSRVSSPTSERSQGPRWFSWLFLFCLLVGILTRIFLVLHTSPVIAGDEAVTGIQAENILRGDHPIYYYGQSYMGSLEAYIIALFFAIAGPSVLILRIALTCISLVLVPLTWGFACALADEANLAGRGRTCFVAIATLVAALPPLYDMVLELRSFGGYVEAMIIMLWLLWASLRLIQRWRVCASGRELALRWSGIGFLIGLGLWIDPLTIYGIIAAGLWIGCFVFLELIRPRRVQKSRLDLLRELCLMCAGIPAALVGLAPAIYYGATNSWSNFVYMFNNGGSVHEHRLQTFLQVEKLYGRCIAPRVIGGTLSTEPFVTQYHPAILTPGFVLNSLCIALAGMAILLALFWQKALVQQLARLTLLPLLFGFCLTAIYGLASISTASIYAGCGPWDLTGRYVAPLAIVLPFFLAAVVALLWDSRWDRLPRFFTAGKKSTDNDNSLNRNGHSRDFHGSQTKIRVITRGLLLIILLFYFSTQFSAYMFSSTHNTFQTSGCIPAPDDHSAIINYMKSEHLQYAFTTGWIGDPLTLKTNQSIIATEPQSRLPGFRDTVLHARHYGLIVFAHHNDVHPALLQALDQQHYRYHMKRFETVPGWDVMVVNPLDRNVPLDDPTLQPILQPLYDGCSA